MADNSAPIEGFDWMNAGSTPEEPAEGVEPSVSPPPGDEPAQMPSPDPTVNDARPKWAPDVPASVLDENVWYGQYGPLGPSGWMNNVYNLAANLVNAAYTAAICGHTIRGKSVRRLNCHWNRPLDHDVKPHGYNGRGDLAPHPVHIQLDGYLDARRFTPLERRLSHGVLDKIWFLHSRSERVDEALDREFDHLDEPWRRVLGRLLNEEMLDDMRLVMCAVDPRKKVIYGQTRDSSPAPRLIRHVDMESLTFRSDDDDTDNEHNGIPPISYRQSGWEQHAQFVHEKMRLVRRLDKKAIQYEDLATQAQIRVNELLKRHERAKNLEEILRRGVEAERGPLRLLAHQEQFAIGAHERRRVEDYDRWYEEQRSLPQSPFVRSEVNSEERSE